MNYQDVLAMLGVGSAHPGGFTASMELIRSLPIKPGSRVLEIGCGTGRTACYLAQEKRCQVTAVDIRELMIEKARLRSMKQGIPVDFQVADATNLPFASDTFDLVFAESVTVFVNIPQALKEYCRVTKKGGRLYDREMCQAKALSPHVQRMIRKIYGVQDVPTFEEWVSAVRTAGYSEAGLQNPALVPEQAGYEDIGIPDMYQEVSPGAFSADAQKVIYDNMTFMKDYHKFLGYAVVIATK